MSKMNTKLKKLYDDSWSKLTAEVQKVKVSPAAQPLLIKVNEEYEKANFKVIIFGQETDGWHEKFNETQASVDLLMERYYRYFYKLSEGGKKRNNRAFWSNKNFKYFENNLKVENKNIAFLWNNISKIGNFANGKGKPHSSIRDLERIFFNVVHSEIEILQPDLIIFTTGKRDSYIRHHFGEECEFLSQLHLPNGDIAVETNNLIAEVKLKAFPDICAIRVEHPNRRSLSNEFIVKTIERCLKV